MVPRPRASLGAHTLRALNLPAPLAVGTDADGLPLSVQRGEWPTPRAVARVQDRWRIDDEWWREHPISRLYYVVLLDGDMLLTVYHDLVADVWFEQRA